MSTLCLVTEKAKIECHLSRVPEASTLQLIYLSYWKGSFI